MLVGNEAPIARSCRWTRCQLCLGCLTEEVRIPKIKMIMQRNAEEGEEGHELGQFAQTTAAARRTRRRRCDAPGGMLGDERKDGGGRERERERERERREEEERARDEEND